MSVPLRIDSDYVSVSVPYTPERLHTSRRVSSGRAKPLYAVISLLLLAAGTLAGVFVSSASRSAGLRLDSSAAPGASVALSAASVDRNLGFATVTGTATNFSGRPLQDVEAEVELLDASGRPLHFEAAMIAFSRLDRGAASPFSVTMQDDARAVSYRVHFRQLLGARLD
jgi:hypothetical protein